MVGAGGRAAQAAAVHEVGRFQAEKCEGVAVRTQVVARSGRAKWSREVVARKP